MNESTDSAGGLREPPVRKIAIERTAEQLEGIETTETSDSAQLSRALERIGQQMASGEDIRQDEVDEAAYHLKRVYERLVDVQNLYGHEDPEVLNRLE